MSPLSSIHPSAWRDCLESPDGQQTGATEANIEGQGDRIFALQANDLASLTPLQPTFQTVSPRGWVNHSPTGASLVPLVFPFAAFHPVVLIDVADVKPASTANLVARLPVCGAVHYVIVGTALEPVGASLPPEFVTSFAPAHRVGAGTPYSFVLPGAALHQVLPVPAVEPRVGSVSTVNLVNPARRVDNVRSALPVDPVLASRAVHCIRPVRPLTRATRRAFDGGPRGCAR